MAAIADGPLADIAPNEIDNINDELVLIISDETPNNSQSKLYLYVFTIFFLFIDINNWIIDKFTGPISTKNTIFFTVLIILNTLNYVDRFTVSAVLTDIQDHYVKEDADGGMITVFSYKSF